MNSAISQSASNITSTVSNTYATKSTVSGKLDTTTYNAFLTVNANNISAKVSANGVIAAINMSPETITIDAANLNLTGLVTINSLKTAGATTIDGGNIKGGTLTLGGSGNTSGVFKLYDGSTTPVLIGQIDNTGMTFLGGKLKMTDSLYGELFYSGILGANYLHFFTTNNKTSIDEDATFDTHSLVITVVDGANATWGYIYLGIGFARDDCDNNISNLLYGHGLRIKSKEDMATIGVLFTEDGNVQFGAKITTESQIIVHGINIQIDSTNGSIELGSNTTANTPFIDFHSSGHAMDFDARITASAGSASQSGQGVLNVYATGGFYINGNLTPVFRTGQIGLAAGGGVKYNFTSPFPHACWMVIPSPINSAQAPSIQAYDANGFMCYVGASCTMAYMAIGY